MLDRVIDFLPIPTNEHVDRVYRNRRLRELKSYCVKDDVGFYPESIRPPLFAKAVDEYVAEKTKTDLPKSQFTETTKHKDTFNDWVEELKDYKEIGGLLDLTNQQMKVICYASEPGMFLETDEAGITFRSSTILPQVSPVDIQHANPLVSWHTHPTGSEVPSKGDIEHIKSVLKLTDKQFFFVIYSPLKNRSYWYRMCPMKKSNN